MIKLNHTVWNRFAFVASNDHFAYIILSLYYYVLYICVNSLEYISEKRI